ncbi:MAG: peptidylprolyl isomerase [Chloroflexaceae bacterium]|nr:peptidylprolyl isomerase [Chloroflexaceae bacterium]
MKMMMMTMSAALTRCVRIVLVVLMGLVLAACEIPIPGGAPSPTPGAPQEQSQEPVSTATSRPTPSPGTASGRGERKTYAALPPMTIDPQGQYDATITTPRGDIVIRLRPDIAPVTVNSFVFLAREGFYDGLTWHRVIRGFMAQGGDPTGTGMGGPGYQVPAEFTDQILYDRPGIVAMARANDPDSAGSQFFITTAPAPFLNEQYTVFGEVMEGQDIVDGIPLRDPETAREPGEEIVRITISEEEPPSSSGGDTGTTDAEADEAGEAPGPGWSRYEGNQLFMWLPESYQGGNLEEDLDLIVENIRSAGTDFEPMARMIEQNPSAFQFYAFDSNIGTSGFMTNVNVVSERVPTSMTVETYLDAATGQFPEAFQVVEKGVTSTERYETVGRLVIASSINEVEMKQVQYAIKAGSMMYVVTHSTSPANMKNACPPSNRASRPLSSPQRQSRSHPRRRATGCTGHLRTFGGAACPLLPLAALPGRERGA